MSFIAQFGGDLKEGKSHEFQAWLNANEEEFTNAHPDGTRYLGTYFSIYGDRAAGSVHFFVELDSYGARDTLAAAGGEVDSVYSKLLNEVVSFMDRNASNVTNALYKSARAATIYGED